MDGGCQSSTPSEFKLQMLEENSERIKDAITKAAKETGYYYHPAIMKFSFFHLLPI